MEVLVEVVMMMVVGVVDSAFETALSLILGFVVDVNFVIGNSEEDAEEDDVDELRKVVVVLTERETV